MIGVQSHRYSLVDPAATATYNPLLRNYNSADQFSGPVAYWHANSFASTGSQFLVDKTGNGNHMRLGSQWPAYIAKGTLNLPGIAGNFASTPDSIANSITGDIDVLAMIASNDLVNQRDILSKYTSASRAFEFRTEPNKTITFITNIAGVNNFATSSVALTVTVGETIWVRATRNASTGEVIFYTCSQQENVPNSERWVQLGTPQSTTAGSIVDAVSDLTVGQRGDGALQFNGRIYYAAVRSGIEGSAVAVFDPSGVNDFATSWVASTSETWTLQWPGARIMETDEGMRLPGTGIGYATVMPDWIPVTNEIELVWYGALDDWTPATTSTLMAAESTTTTRSWNLEINSSAFLRLVLSADGTNVTVGQASIVVPVTNGDLIWIKANWRASDGRCQFFTSPDNITWTQLGANVTIAIASISSNASTVQVGTRLFGTAPVTGKVRRVIVRNSIAGTAVLDVNFAIQTPYTDNFIAATGQMVKLNGQTGTDTNDPVFLAYNAEKYLYLPATAGNSVRAASGNVSAATYSGAGAFDVRFDQAGLGGSNTTTTRRLFDSGFYVDRPANTSSLNVTCRFDNAGTISFPGAYMTGYDMNNHRDRQPIRLVYEPSGTIQLYTAAIGANIMSDSGWTLQDTQAFTPSGNMTFTAIPCMGSGSTGGPLAKVFRARMSKSSTLLWDFYPNRDIQTNTNPTSWQSATGETWTISRPAIGLKASVVDRNLFLLGVDDYMDCPDSLDGLLDFTMTDSLCIVIVWRAYGDPTTAPVLMSKYASSGAGWHLQHGRTSVRRLGFMVSDGIDSSDRISSASWSDGNFHVAVGQLNRSAPTLDLYQDSFLYSSATSIALDSITNNEPVRIGRRGNSTFGDMEFMGAAIFRRALSPGEIANVSNYLQGDTV